jgi:hypothetical protein
MSMRHLLTLALTCAALNVPPALAQTTRVDGGVVSTEAYSFYWETHLTPPVPPLAEGFGTTSYLGDDGVIHRVLLDRGARILFGYEVRVDAEQQQVRLTFAPLSISPERRQSLLGSDSASWTQIPNPTLVVADRSVIAERRTMGVGRGQVIELRLLATSSGQTLTDYVTIQPRWRQPRGFVQVDQEPAFHFSPGPIRDFTLDEAQLQVLRPQVSVNGQPAYTAETVNATARGTVVWIYVPKRGRYALSLLPRAALGFRLAGEVRGNTLRFTVRDETISMFAADQIAPGPGAYRLYVRHDPGWVPTYRHANTDAFILDGADRAEYLVGPESK